MTQLVAFEQQMLEAQRQNAQLVQAAENMHISTATTPNATITPTGQQLEHIVEN